MKAKELRIGNLVTHESINVFRIDEIRQTNEGCVIRMYPCDNLESKMDMFVSLAEPVPLTPELLKKCFLYENGIYRTEKLRGFFLRLQLDDGMYAGYNFGPYSICKVKYLHQLQNLYYALTGEELEIDLRIFNQKEQ